MKQAWNVLKFWILLLVNWNTDHFGFISRTKDLPLARCLRWTLGSSPTIYFLCLATYYHLPVQLLTVVLLSAKVPYCFLSFSIFSLIYLRIQLSTENSLIFLSFLHHYLPCELEEQIYSLCLLLAQYQLRQSSNIEWNACLNRWLHLQLHALRCRAFKNIKKN